VGVLGSVGVAGHDTGRCGDHGEDDTQSGAGGRGVTESATTAAAGRAVVSGPVMSAATSSNAGAADEPADLPTRRVGRPPKLSLARRTKPSGRSFR
jgi:hypothetical protein